MEDFWLNFTDNITVSGEINIHSGIIALEVCCYYNTHAACHAPDGRLPKLKYPP
jgi:hypothetical protein